MVLPQLDCGKMGRWGLSTKTSRLASGGLSPRRRRSTPASIAPRMTGRDRIWVTILFTNHLDLLILLFWRCFHSLKSCRSLTAFIKFLSYWLLAGFTHQHSTLRKEDDMNFYFHFPQTKRLINESCAPVLMKGIRQRPEHSTYLPHERSNHPSEKGESTRFPGGNMVLLFSGTSASTLWISPSWIPLATSTWDAATMKRRFQFDVSLAPWSWSNDSST